MPDPDLLSAPLRYFAEVADRGSFTAAARALHISQPSLSVAVKKLEEALGATLLHRSRQGVSLTRAGEILLEHVRQADRTLEAAKEELLALEQKLHGATEDYVPVAGGELRLLRTKNKFSPKLLSPTHFRCMLNNVELKCGERSTFVELQATARA